MKSSLGFFTAVVLGISCAAEAARADTIFDVEHARANYRAGLISSDDAEMLVRWGVPSGHYPAWYGVSYGRRLPVSRNRWNVRR